MSESIQEMEDRWTLANVARYDANHPKAGQRIVDADPKYAREVFALRTQIEERKQVETPGPQINQQQLDQLNWLQRVRVAKGSDGKPLVLDRTPAGSSFRLNVHRAEQRIGAGESINDLIAGTERDFTAKGITMPAAPLTPIVPVVTLPQAINTNRGPK